MEEAKAVTPCSECGSSFCAQYGEPNVCSQTRNYRKVAEPKSLDAPVKDKRMRAPTRKKAAAR